MRTIAVILAAGCLLAASSTPAPAQQQAFSDEAVEKAIERGVKFLLSQQRENGSWPPFGEPGQNYHASGPTALATYALLESGISPQDERMAKALDWMAQTPENMTYSLGLRCSAWQIANVTTRKKYYKLLAKEARMLYSGTKSGSYSYSVPTGGGDNSNSQYGLLGVWAAARGDVEVPKQYWQLVLSHWLRCQNPDGGWDYGHQGNSTATMSAAGVASLFVCFDNIFAAKFAECGSDFRLSAIDKGLEWFDRNFLGTLTGKVPMGIGGLDYYLYGVERVGLASGYKYFGKADWYKLGCEKLLAVQQANGSWAGSHGGPNVGTAFCLLFLVRGRNPVLFNKLEYEGDWNNRPRDLASLTGWLSQTFEITVNWQIVNLRVPIRELHDAPILYIAGSKAPTFTDEQLEKLREYVWQGGTLFSCRECGGREFGTGIREVYKKLFPQYELVDCGPEHEINDVYFQLKGRPKFSMISNGIRPLVIHTDEDLPMEWQLQRYATKRREFEAAANVFMYVTDRGTLRRRATSLWPEAPEFTAARTVRLARLKTSGHYDPEPLAYERFARLLGRETATKLEVLGPMAIEELPEANAPVATLTGVDKFTVTPEQQAILKRYVEAGGTLVIDAAGGSEDFDKSARELIAAMFGADRLGTIATSHDLYRDPLPGVKDVKIEEVQYRRVTRKMLGKRKDPRLQAVFLKERPALIYSKQDLTAGLVGYPSLTCDGYDPGDARTPGSAYQLMRNIVLYAARSLPAEPTSAPAATVPTAPAPAQPAPAEPAPVEPAPAEPAPH